MKVRQNPETGKWFAIGEDGYSTSPEVDIKEEAEYIMANPDDVSWDY